MVIETPSPMGSGVGKRQSAQPPLFGKQRKKTVAAMAKAMVVCDDGW